MSGRRDRSHAGYGSPFANLVYAYRQSDGAIVHVRDVDSGFDADLLCPAATCRSPLTARKGPLGRAEHFAHRPGTRPCTWKETSAHYEAKAALAAALTLTLPAGVAEFEGARLEVSRQGRLDFDDVSIEFRMDGITPDVVLRKSVNGVVHELLVEVKVTNGCGPEKIARIREGKHAAVEIDLARWKHASVEDIHAAVLRDAPRSWLYNDKIEAGVGALKAEAQARAEAAAKVLLDRARAVAGARASHPKGLEAVAALDAIGEGRLCRVKVDSDGVFSVPSEEWQAALAWRYVIVEYGDSYLSRGFSLTTAATWMRASGLVHPGFREPLESNVIRALKRADPGFRSPQMLVKQYLQGVARLGPLISTENDRWERRPAFDVAVRKSQDDERRRVQRTEGVRRRVLTLVAQATEKEREGFEVRTWEREPVEGLGLTLDAIVRDASFEAFEEGLSRIEAAVGWRGVWEDGSTYGLPLDGAIRRGVEAKLAREAADKEARREAERSRIQGLVERIEACAVRLMGPDEGLGWMAPRRAALLISDAARNEAHVALADFERALKAQAALDDLAAEMRAILEKAAEVRFGDATSLFLHTGNNHCRGQHPWTYTVDRHTLREALHAVAMAPAPRRRKY
ncbi:hypothetical protein [Phenylobacterium sp.]|uniref:hypothetical protein n=1 Tax=Phenylobacterium sp. TaxID=1871053 RepID=UPI0030013CCF